MTRTTADITARLNATTDAEDLSELLDDMTTWPETVDGDTDGYTVHLATGETLVYSNGAGEWICRPTVYAWIAQDGHTYTLEEWTAMCAETGQEWHIRLDGQAIVSGAEHWAGGEVLAERVPVRP